MHEKQYLQNEEFAEFYFDLLISTQDFLYARKLIASTDFYEAFEQRVIEKIQFAEELSGQDGVYFQDKEQRVYQPARTVKAVDTTGAGDTFTGYYIAAVIEGKSAIEALTFATNAAALAVMKAGAANAIPKRHDVEKY